MDERTELVEPNTTFISHASEDKRYVKLLVDKLLARGIRVWYDDYEIGVGDSIRTSINDGLRRSRYGVVVLSPNFFAKRWPPQELAALAGRVQEGKLLPVYHNMSPAEVAEKDPLLGDIKGIPTDLPHTRVVDLIAAKINAPNTRDAEGTLYYRWQTVRIADVPLGDDQCIENVTFEDCVIVGLAVLSPGSELEIRDCIFNGPQQFIPVPAGRGVAGTFGLRNVKFIRSRFKDIGFIAYPNFLDLLNATTKFADPGWKFPDHLQ